MSTKKATNISSNANQVKPAKGINYGESSVNRGTQPPKRPLPPSTNKKSKT